MNSAVVAAEVIDPGMSTDSAWVSFYFIENKRFYQEGALRGRRIYHLLFSIIECASAIYWLITPEKKSVRRLWARAAG